MPNDTFRERRAVLIAAQQLVQKIDDIEDALEVFVTADQPAYAAWVSERFQPERAEIARLEAELNQAVQAHNQMVALTKLEGLTMTEALRRLREEDRGLADLDEAAREALARERDRREQVIREEFEREVTERFANTPVRPLDEMDQEKLKLVYRKLVRRLHPDVQGPQIDATETRWQKRIWLISQTARAAGDVNQLESIYRVNLLRQMDMSDFTLGDALDTRAWLEKELARQELSLAEARRHAAFGFSQTPDLADVERRTRQEYEMERQFLIGELEDLRGQHAQIDQPAMRRRRRRRIDERQMSFFD